MSYIFDLHKKMTTNNVILIYDGEFNQDVVKTVLSMVEKNMEIIGEQMGIKRKVFNVMVECLQNIVRHAEDRLKEVPDDAISAIFMIGKDGDVYKVSSGNRIQQSEVGDLDDKLKYINSLDKDGLKQLYKDILQNSNLSDKGGAGLGFVDMVRKSGNAIDYEFSKIDDEYSFFSMTAKVSR